MKNLKNFKQYNESIDNFTARYYDNYDDEEPPATESDLMNINKENIRKVQMYEDLLDYYTYECSGSPSPEFRTKADFNEFMYSNGFKHTTLNKNTDMLIVTDKDQGTLKCQKAEKYNIPIYTYSEARIKVKEMSNDLAKYNM